jgi:hypothetical protein
MEQVEDAHMPDADQGGQASLETQSVSAYVESSSVAASTVASSTTSNQQFDVVDARRHPPTALEKRKVEEKKELERKLKG